MNLRSGIAGRQPEGLPELKVKEIA